jgi:HEAT repeat protein
MNRIFATLLMLVLGVPAQASADSLRTEIAQARERAPEAFSRLEALRAQVIAQPPPWERRGQVGRAMKALGPGGLFPLLALIQDAPALERATPATREMLLVGAIEAVGELRDARTVSVMRQFLDGNEANAQILRAAADALGTVADRPGAEDEIAYLAAHAKAGDRLERAAISGLGYTRHAIAVAALRARLENRPSAEVAEAVADAMGFLGSSWAWTALGPARADEGLDLRDELSVALTSAYAAYQARARAAIGRALLMIDHPSTPNRLAALRSGADPSLAADVQALERRWLHLR